MRSTVLRRMVLSVFALGAVSAAQAGIVGTPLPTALEADQGRQLMGLLEEEAGILEQALTGRMRVVVLATTDPIVASFIARGVLKTDQETLAHQQNGLAAVLAEGGQVNGQKTDACYVIFDQRRAAHLWRNFVQPLAHGENLHPAAAFLVGHEVGHCLDHAERSAKLNSGTSTRAQATTFGVQPDAWSRAGGTDKVDRASYGPIAKALFKDGAQRQYQERVADPFGVLWAWHRGADASLLAGVMATRDKAETWSSHATAPSLAGIEQFREQATTANMGDLWTIARALQVRTGVDARLQTGGDKAVATQTSTSKPQTQTQPQVATQTPQPVRQVDRLGPVRFDSMRRFGSGAQGSGSNRVR